jgi:preprotein translocase subunit SecD
MKLGLDLSGGVHFLLEVNTEKVVGTRLESMVREVRSAMREEKLRYHSVKLVDRKAIVSKFKTQE